LLKHCNDEATPCICIQHRCRRPNSVSARSR